MHKHVSYHAWAKDGVKTSRYNGSEATKGPVCVGSRCKADEREKLGDEHAEGRRGLLKSAESSPTE